MKSYLSCLLVLIAASCNDENEIRYSVDPALEPYVSTFYEEAAARGVAIPMNLVAELKPVQSAVVVETRMDQNYLYFHPTTFNSIQERFIEAHVYNMLGGLFLKRGPSEEFSFMNPDVRFGCPHTLHPCVYDGYTPTDKTALFDELFGDNL